MPRYANVSIAYDTLSVRGENPDSHLWLYAKNHYIRRNVWEDLKWLVGTRSLLDPRYVTDGGVLLVLGNIIFPLLRSSEHQLEQFLHRLSPSHTFHFTLRDTYDVRAAERYEDRLLGGYLSIMSTARVKDGDKVLIEMCDPDPLLLPTVKVCSKGGEHEPVEGKHSNLFCQKCNQTLN